MRKRTATTLSAVALAVLTTLSPVSAATTFSPGTYKVGGAMRPGTYRVIALRDHWGHRWCYWATMRRPGVSSSIIENDYVTSKVNYVYLTRGQWFQMKNCTATRVSA